MPTYVDRNGITHAVTHAQYNELVRRNGPSNTHLLIQPRPLRPPERAVMSPEQVLNDFARRYGQTYVHVQAPDSDDKTLCYISSIEPSSTKLGVINLTSSELGRISLNFGSAHTLLFIPPPVGIFQHGPDSIICRRNPQKQYRRGICPENTTFNDVTWSITGSNVSWNEPMIASALKGVTYSFKDALEKLGSGKYRSVAMGSNFSLSVPMNNSKDYVMFFWDTPAARVNDKGELVLTIENCLAPQIKGMLQ